MKYANAALLSILNNTDQSVPLLWHDLYTITFKHGLVKRYADGDKDVVTIDGFTFSSNSTLFAGAKYKLKRGLEVDEMDVQIIPDPLDLVCGATIVQAIKRGLFDRAIIVRQRQFFTPAEATAFARQIVPAANPLTLFTGEITNADSGDYQGTLKVKSLVNLLNQTAPPRQYQANCTWTFGSTQCGVSRSGLQASGTVSTSSNGRVISCNLSQGAGYFMAGVLRFTSGNNSGVSRSIKSWVPNAATLVAPFPNPVVAGDTFVIMPGCIKMLDASQTLPASATGAAVSNSTTAFFSDVGDSYYDYGYKVTFTSGANNGQSAQISQIINGKIFLRSALPNVPQYGDTFNISSSGRNYRSATVLGSSKSSVSNALGHPSGYFTGGTIKFTSGVNNGVTRTIASWVPGLCTTTAPFPNAPNDGDSFIVTQTANSTYASCAYYSNRARYGGFPYIPVPENAY